VWAENLLVPCVVEGGGDRIHPEKARKSGWHGVQNVAQCVACSALTLVVRQYITNLSNLCGAPAGCDSTQCIRTNECDPREVSTLNPESSALDP